MTHSEMMTLPAEARLSTLSREITALTERLAPVSEAAVLRSLEVGDLIYIPGHVMMVIGFDHGMPYVIHDTTGISYRDGQGEVRRVVLNGVSVTPLTPLLFSRKDPTVDHITSILRVRP